MTGSTRNRIWHVLTSVLERDAAITRTRVLLVSSPAVCVWSAEADQEAVSDDGRRWLSRMLTPRLRRNRSRQKGPLHVHMRFGRRVTEIPEGSGKQFKQFLRFGR